MLLSVALPPWKNMDALPLLWKIHIHYLIQVCCLLKYLILPFHLHCHPIQLICQAMNLPLLTHHAALHFKSCLNIKVSSWLHSLTTVFNNELILVIYPWSIFISLPLYSLMTGWIGNLIFFILSSRQLVTIGVYMLSLLIPSFLISIASCCPASSHYILLVSCL